MAWRTVSHILPDDISECAGLEARRRDIRFEVGAGEGRRIVAGDAQRPVGENALAIGQMPDDLDHTPLLRRGAPSRLLRSEWREERCSIPDLTIEDSHNVTIGHATNVRVVVGKVFTSGWSPSWSLRIGSGHSVPLANN